MRSVTRLMFGFCPLFLTLALVAGCGGTGSSAKLVRVKGQLLEKGAPLKVAPPGTNMPPGDPGVRLTFNLLNDAGTAIVDAHEAEVNLADGAFGVPGPTGKGIPVGKYRISIHIGMSGSPDRLKERFTPEKSPIVREIKEDTDLTIDVSKPQG